MDDDVTKLQDDLSRLRGPARLPTLVRLGHKLSQEYWRAGPGQPAALGKLSSALEAWREAYSLTGAGDDPARGQIAALYGWLLATRYTAHGGAPQDRQVAMSVLAEATKFATLPPVHATMARLILGQLFLSRAVETLGPGARSGFLGGPPAGGSADISEAARLFRGVLAGEPLNPDIVTAARTLLDITEMIQPLLSGDLARFDLGRLSGLASELSRLQRGMGPYLSVLNADPMDYPVLDMPGPATEQPTIPPRRATPAAPTRPSTSASARGAAREQLGALAADPVLAVWEQARALLTTDLTVSAADLDAFVGAAANAVTAEEDGPPVEHGLDRLLLAVGLCLRHRRDGIGWGDDGDETTDAALSTAAEHLAAASDRVPPGHPAAIVLVEAVGAVLDDTRPLSGPIMDIADSFSSYAEKIPSPPPTVTALAEFCRAVAALRDDVPLDLDAFTTAVPADPWPPALSVAVAHARLAAAVRAGEPIATDPALGELAGLLDALLRDDRDALNASLDALPGRQPPRVAAVLGAVRLKLHDPGAAIPLLSRAARALNDSGLRTRTWWRLAEAYRLRGAAGDIALSRDAGVNALSGPDPDRRRAARFAGWMLTDGQAEDAFVALEVAGSSPEGPGDQLIRDVLSVVIGTGPRAADAADPPTPARVAAALRELDAAALLYLHPTDDAGRTAGVLCLHAGTDRLDLLANVPVADPLTSDDPGLPAVLGRWTSGNLLIAATGGLDRLALAAVRTGAGRRLAQDVALSSVTSGAQVVRLGARPVTPVEAEPLFVVNPRGDRDSSMADVLVLRRLFYPRSACLGRSLEPVDAAGTPDDLLKRLPGVSVLHLACGVRDDTLELAEGRTLDMAGLHGGGGLAVLTEGTAPRLLNAGFTGIVGWRWEVPAPFAALALFMVHLHLVDRRLAPAAAVNATQRWMLDTDRVLPPFLTGAHLHTVTTTDLTQPALWAALVYHGR
ncbi:hypothetical protein J5U46_16350 [Micromonospora tulbaghiae]|uniref:CHAT domain-containing protein n=1 Tax=Micromonospora tulbaghiae TaxID=479978 RepID=A0AAW4JIC0_9ACTN|nr:hypothetical protein [Micromonospora tulbaghiae]MBO4141728.1 hypothetical protein [Micromonospora tulbaghiae]